MSQTVRTLLSHFDEAYSRDKCWRPLARASASDVKISPGKRHLSEATF